MNVQLQKDNLTPPYVYTQYNVKCFTSNPISTVKSVPARLVNCLIKAINEGATKEERLSRLIVIIPDWDMLKYMNHNTHGITKLTTKLVQWMVTNIDWALLSRKEQIGKLKPGALSQNEPKVIWVLVINRLYSFDKVSR